MPFAPHEIENKKFVTALRGYQTDEVDAFLRAVAADYRTALKALKTNSTAPGELVADIERVMRSASDAAERDAAELRRAAAEESAALREAADREAAELREATQREAETCFIEITRQAEELHRIESSVRRQLHALEHTIVEAKQILDHMPGLYAGTEPEANARGGLVATGNRF